MKKTRCDICGRKAKKQVSLPGYTRLILCNDCVGLMKAQMASHGITHLGNGVHSPESAVVLSVAEYGSPVCVDYVSAAVHQGGRVIESEVYPKKELTDEQIVIRIDSLLQRHQVSGILALDQCVPVEFDANGKLVIRIADGQGKTLADTTRRFENN